MCGAEGGTEGGLGALCIAPVEVVNIVWVVYFLHIRSGQFLCTSSSR